MTRPHCENDCERDTPDACKVRGCQSLPPGIIGILCEATTVERIVRKTSAGPLHKAVCNRWYRHPGDHQQVRGKDFALEATWQDQDCGAPDIMKERRREMAAAKRVGEVRVEVRR